MGYKSVEDFKADERVYYMLNSNGNSVEHMRTLLKKENSFIVNHYSVNKTKYEIKVESVYEWEKLGRKGSNINEFFEVIRSFDT